MKIETTGGTLSYCITYRQNTAVIYDGCRSAVLPANLLQAQRDYFGAHTYERIDRQRGEAFHTNWTGKGNNTAAGIYQV